MFAIRRNRRYRPEARTALYLTRAASGFRASAMRMRWPARPLTQSEMNVVSSLANDGSDDLLRGRPRRIRASANRSAAETICVLSSMTASMGAIRDFDREPGASTGATIAGRHAERIVEGRRARYHRSLLQHTYVVSGNWQRAITSCALDARRYGSTRS